MLVRARTQAARKVIDQETPPNRSTGIRAALLKVSRQHKGVTLRGGPHEPVGSLHLVLHGPTPVPVSKGARPTSPKLNLDAESLGKGKGTLAWGLTSSRHFVLLIASRYL
jgi:hypothetical protein